MIKNLVNLANHLDKKGLRAEANLLDKIIKKMAEEDDGKNSHDLNVGEAIDKLREDILEYNKHLRIIAWGLPTANLMTPESFVQEYAIEWDMYLESHGEAFDQVASKISKEDNEFLRRALSDIILFLPHLKNAYLYYNKEYWDNSISHIEDAMMRIDDYLNEKQENKQLASFLHNNILKPLYSLDKTWKSLKYGEES